MSKRKLIESVLQDWVHTLPFQMQALLLTAMRGADGCTKHNAAKGIVRYLRGAVLKPAADWQGDNDQDFMWGEWEKFPELVNDFFADPDAYPHHFIMHLVHSAEVVGYKHSDDNCTGYWFRQFYLKACKAFHMNPETEEQMDARLNDFGYGVHSIKH